MSVMHDAASSSAKAASSISQRRQRSSLGNAWRDFVKAPLSAKLGMLIIAIYLIAALFAPVIAPYGEAEVVGAGYQPWGWQHLMGTDQLGRDLFSRLIYGARNTVGVALLTTMLSFALGGCLGLLAAIAKGWVDQILSRIVDALMAIPVLIFALLLLSIFGTSVIKMVLVMAVMDSTRVFRLTRAVSQSIVVMDYVEAARLRGEKLPWIMRREILPNIMAPAVAEFGLRFCFVFLTISALSFLGLGLQPPTADWGSMVYENKMLITVGRLTPLLPAGAIALLTVGVNFVVDWFLHKTSGLRE
jgi:peptide/nickel transport system permease protein